MPHRFNELHAAALGYTERTAAALSTGSIDINQLNNGFTPLMRCSTKGCVRVARILLANGASTAIVGDYGLTALHLSALIGNLAVTKLLIEAGADLEAKAGGASGEQASSPLHLASQQGHGEVVRALIDAGANINARKNDGSTPLNDAAFNGRLDVVRLLLGAEADPLLPCFKKSGRGRTFDFTPLDSAAEKGHSQVVRELFQRFGLAGCGGASGGVVALRLAAYNGHLHLIPILANAGVVDSGHALGVCAHVGRAASAKRLLQHYAEEKSAGDRAYVDTRDDFGATPLLCCIRKSLSAPVVRLMVNPGADTTSAIRTTNWKTGVVELDDTPLALTTRCITDKTMLDGTDATEEQLHKLEAIRRVLLTVEAARALSWLWHTESPQMDPVSESSCAQTGWTDGTPLKAMLPLLRRRAGRRGVLLAALSR